MKWTSLLNDLKEKVGLSPSSQTPRSPAASSSSDGAGSAEALDSAPFVKDSTNVSPATARGKDELEVDFKKFWEEFRSSISEKEKEAALSMTVDIFCRLVKQQSNASQLLTKLVDAHIFSFVIGRAFVTDVEKLRIYSKGGSLDVAKIISFFSDVTKDGVSPGSNLLYAVEVLVSGPSDKQPMLDSGMLCCLIHILNALLNADDPNKRFSSMAGLEESILCEQSYNVDSLHVRRLEIEESVVHIMKALASHTSATSSVIEDDSLQLLFHMVAAGSLSVFSKFKEDLVPLHTIQLHRHAMQILGLVLVNDNGSTAKYIHEHHLVLY